MRRLALAACAISLLILGTQDLAAQSLRPVASFGGNYGLSIDTSPAPSAFVGWCPTCAKHALIGPGHDILVLTRSGTPWAHVGAAWAYSPGTLGTLATGGAVVAKAGISLGAPAQAALKEIPVSGDTQAAWLPFAKAAGTAFTIEGYGGPRIGGANGIPKIPYGISFTLTIPYSNAALSALFGL